jgi:hypothetical protein
MDTPKTVTTLSPDEINAIVYALRLVRKRRNQDDELVGRLTAFLSEATEVKNAEAN